VRKKVDGCAYDIGEEDEQEPEPFVPQVTISYTVNQHPDYEERRQKRENVRDAWPYIEKRHMLLLYMKIYYS